MKWNTNVIVTFAIMSTDADENEREQGYNALNLGNLSYTHFDSNSILIINLTKQDAKFIARKFHQDSFYFGTARIEEDNYDVESCEGPEFETRNKFILSDMPTINDDELTILDTQSFEKSMNETLSFTVRGQNRKKAYDFYFKKTKRIPPEGSAGWFSSIGESLINETTTNRVYQHIVNDNFAIVSPYRGENSEEQNKKLMAQLKKDVRDIGLGYIQLLSRWVEDGIDFDEQSLLIPNMTAPQALELGKKYNQSSVIVKDEDGCREICTTAFDNYHYNDVVRTFNLDNLTPLNMRDAEDILAHKRGGPFTLKEIYVVNSPRPSTFGNEYTKDLIYEANDFDINESNSVANFVDKSKVRMFATISAFIDKSFFTNENNEYDEQGHKRYNFRSTEALKNDIIALGLEYQKVSGVWDGNVEYSFVVWNTMYRYNQFEALMLKLAENYRQWAVCIGRYEDNKYNIDMWETESLDDISYRPSTNFTTIRLADATDIYATFLTRHIYDKNQNINLQNKPAFKFEDFQNNLCCASSNSLVGCYKRESLLKSYLNKELSNITNEEYLNEARKRKKKKIYYNPNAGDVEYGVAFFNHASGADSTSSECVAESWKKEYLKEGGLARLYTHIKDKNSFAIIGSQDKDTKEDRSKDLMKLLGKFKFQGLNYINGQYVYENGEQGNELSVILYNISKEEVLRFGRALNQETILYKDKDFFGYIRCDDGAVDIEFEGDISFDPNKIADIGASSQLTSKGWNLNKHPKVKNTPFVFEAYLLQPDRKQRITNYYLIDEQR